MIFENIILLTTMKKGMLKKSHKDKDFFGSINEKLLGFDNLGD